MTRPYHAIFGLFVLFCSLLGSTVSVFAVDGDEYWMDGFGAPPGGDGIDHTVAEVCEYQGELIAGGDFHLAGSTAADYIAVWDGTEWGALGSGINDHFYDMVVYNGLLIVGGTFSQAGGVLVDGIAAWDGAEWSALDAYPSTFSGARLLAVHNGELFVGLASRQVLSWNGDTWTDWGLGPADCWAVRNGRFVAAALWDQYGQYEHDGLYEWVDDAWIPIDTTCRIYTCNDVLLREDRLLLAGELNTADGYLGAGGIPQWDGSSWAEFSDLPGYAVNRIDVVNDHVYVAGGFSYSVVGDMTSGVLAWNGYAWRSLGSGINGAVLDFRVLDGDLAFGGLFDVAGGKPSENIAIWQGPAFVIPYWTASLTYPAYIREFWVRAANLYLGMDWELIHHYREDCQPALCYDVQQHSGRVPVDADALKISKLYIIAYQNIDKDVDTSLCEVSMSLFVPVFDGDTWRLANLTSWFEADTSVDLELPGLLDTLGTVEEFHIAIDLAQWLSDPRPMQDEYSFVNGVCSDLPGFLLGTTEIVFDSLAGSEGPFATTLWSGTLPRIDAIEMLPAEPPTAYSCRGNRGNVDNDPLDQVSLGDLTVMIDHLFVSFEDLECWEEANVDESQPEGEGSISLGDLTVMIDHLFVSFADLPPCP